jgi:hypothetical protein
VKIDFLRQHGAQRIRDYAPQPLLLGDSQLMEDEPAENVRLDYERQPADWQPLELSDPDAANWEWRPRRFIDGKDAGRTVAWLHSREGYPVPVRLSEIGAVEMRDVGGELRREFEVVERVVSLMIDLFPWSEVERFAAELREHGFRLLPASVPAQSGSLYDFERMRKTTQNRSNDEMTRLERRALAQDCATPTVVDGRLDPRASAFDQARHHVVGVVKQHSQNYLHAQGWRTFYKLRPRQRTPAFRLKCGNLDVVTWYLRLDGARGELPNWGVVRVEVPERLFERQIGRDFGYVNRLSRLLYEYRCRDEGYGRSAVTIHPIQRAEVSLGALFTPADALLGHFYRLTGL